MRRLALVRKHVGAVVNSYRKKFQALTRLDPQSSLLLLSSSLVPAIGYLLQVTPPELIHQAAFDWDNLVDEARAQCATLSDGGRVPQVGTDLLLASNMKARLPFRLDGLGHFSAVRLSPIAFFASVRNYLALHETDDHPQSKDELQDTFSRLCDILPDVEYHKYVTPLVDIISTNSMAPLPPPPPKLQKILSIHAHRQAKEELVALLEESPCATLDLKRIHSGELKSDAWIPFCVAPTSADLSIPPELFVSGLRFYLLLPQLLRRTSAVPVMLDQPREDRRDFSYQADLCRRCSGASCDRHLIHAHACPLSKSKISVRHDMVKAVRAAAIKQAGFTNVRIEPRTNAAQDQRRADIIFTAHWGGPTRIEYITDDTIGHPFSPSNAQIDVLAKLSALKEDHYAEVLTALRSTNAVLFGQKKIVFWPCAFTSLGEYGMSTTLCMNAIVAFFRHEAERKIRLDGLKPVLLAAVFRFSLRAKLQAALLKGNGYLATAVGV